MQTKLWQGDNARDIAEAAAYLRQGELVALPTETVYGLGADALNDAAIQKIFAAKGRPSDNPLNVLIYDRQQLSHLVSDVSAQAETLMMAFWPGALTLILPKQAGLPDRLTAGLATVGVRMPDHPAALALLKACDIPIAAPSANLSGKPSPTCAEHVYHDLAGRITGIVDGGSCAVGVESTVLDMTTRPPTILRPGGISREAIEQLIGTVQMVSSEVNAPSGKYQHYAPQAELIFLADTPEGFAQQFAKLIEARSFGLLISAETATLLGETIHHIPTRILGQRSQPETLAHELFDALRWFDEQAVAVIYSERFPEEQLGAVLMDRLQKAAAPAPKGREQA